MLNIGSFISKILLGLFFVTYTSYIVAQKKLDNKNFSPNLGTVILAPKRDNALVEAQFPAIPLGNLLNLRFDIIDGDQRDYMIKFVHCSHDWYPSDIDDIEYLNEYNEFRVTDKETSFDTNTPYIHYTFDTPQLLLSGNYVMKIYEESGEDELIFTRRFIVYTQIASIGDTLRKGISGINSAETQQFSLVIAYGNTGVSNPSTELFTYIYKNQDWKNVHFLSNPQFIKAHEKIIEYSQYSKETSFDAGNEFRIFDIRSSQVRRENVDKLIDKGSNIIARLTPIEFDERLAYEEIIDLNGSFIVSTDIESDDANISGDYFNTHFTINVQKKINGNIYLVGSLVEGLPKQLTQLHYNAKNSTYSTTLILKQGYYNYSVIRKDMNNKRFNLDGNYYATQNVYDFFVYRRLPQKRYDEVVGYLRRDTRKK